MLPKSFFWGIIFCSLLASCFESSKPAKPAAVIVKSADTLDTDTLPRSSITFILGEDENSRNPYYSLANQYYRLSDSDKTEIVIDTIFSLLEVRNYLEEHCPENGRPWGLINLVSHGNEFIDLCVKVTPDGERASGESLMQAVSDSVFMPLDSEAADKKTLINLHGCAVGKNISLLNALGGAFGGNKRPLRVKASKLFEYYSYPAQNKNPQMIRHYYAKVWYGFFKADSIPDANTLAEQFQEKYPADSMNWLDAIHRQTPSNPSQTYHMTMRIPVVWEDFYENKDQLPDWRTRKKQLKWLEEKAEFQELMKKTRIPEEYFDVKFYTLIYNADTGTVYSSKLKARAGIICVIKPILGKEDSQNIKYPPFIPLAEDSSYFSFNCF